MIVMKFGGSSLASASSIKRVAGIVRSQIDRSPIVVVSAFGETTDQLLAILESASRGNSYLGWKSQEELRVYHFCLAEDLVNPDQLELLDKYMRQVFRDLHIRMLEVCEGERSVTPELRDWVVSLGEQLSSRIVAAAFQSHGISAMHVDARKLILTDDQFTQAEPRYWETYANIRWAMAPVRDHVVVFGGFIGATEDGRTTTLGRGGSDLTASLVGAAVNAEEIQVWKDVDGLLTWDPKIKAGAHRVKYISYSEMAELALAGATILHPDSIAPAQRLRIPITIRNTFRPECEGTAIGGPRPGAAVKSIACKSNLTILELRSPREEGNLEHFSPQLRHLCSKQRAAASLLGMSERVIYLALEGSMKVPELEFWLDRCVQAHLRTRQAIITLVGEGISASSIPDQAAEILAGTDALILPSSRASCSIRIAVPAEAVLLFLERLSRAFVTEYLAGAESPGESHRLENSHPASSMAEAGPTPQWKKRDLALPGAPA